MLNRLTDLFLVLLNMSLTASWAIIAVLAARLLLQKAPKRVTFWLWAVVLFRLLCPFSWRSGLSLIPSAHTVSAEILYAETPTIQSGVAALDAVVNPVLPAGVPEASVNPLQIWAAAGALVWAAGVLCLLVYSGVTVGRLAAALKKAQPRAGQSAGHSTGYSTRVCVLPGLCSPFVFGLTQPVIYLPEGLSEEKAMFIFSHEKAHLHRGDPYTKPLAWAAVCLHWFNPLVWAAFFAFEKDMELSCDELVVRDYSPAQRKAYSETLLELAAGRRFVGGCPLAFGESNVKSRIKRVLYAKKPVMWAAAAAAVLVVALCVALALNPQSGAAVSTAGEEPAQDGPAEIVAGRGDATRAESSPAGEGSSAAVQQATAGSAPRPDETEPLTKENTSAFIRRALESLTLHADNTVTFQLPDAIPTDPFGVTKLTITLNLSYQVENGVSDNPSLLDWATDWHGGEVFTGKIEPDRGTLTEVMLRVAFMTLLKKTAEGETYEEYDAYYTRLTAPFTYAQGASVSTPGAELLPSGGSSAVNYTLKNGKSFAVACTLPSELTLAADVPADALPQVGDTQDPDSALPLIAVMQGDAVVGMLAVYDYATSEKETLADIDTAADRIPMPVYATVNLSNHAGYGVHYKVVSHTATASNAVTKFEWQNLEASGYGASVEIPFQSADCVLAFDLAAEPCFAVFKLEEGVLTGQQLTALAKSIRLS